MRKLILLFLFFLPLFSHSQSYIHYIGPVHSKQNQTLYIREQMLYITSPYEEGDVYVRITSYDGTELFTLSPNGSISYSIGNNENSKLVIIESSLGKNHPDKGFKVEGFKDASFTDPVSIFAEQTNDGDIPYSTNVWKHHFKTFHAIFANLRLSKVY